MLRIFRVHHKKELIYPRSKVDVYRCYQGYQYQARIHQEESSKMRDSPFPLYLENYVLWNESGLIMKSIKNDDEITVEESELPKAFYGYYETRDVPVVAFYLNEDELEFLKSRNKASNVRYEFLMKMVPVKVLFDGCCSQEELKWVSTTF